MSWEGSKRPALLHFLFVCLNQKSWRAETGWLFLTYSFKNPVKNSWWSEDSAGHQARLLASKWGKIKSHIRVDRWQLSLRNSPVSIIRPNYRPNIGSAGRFEWTLAIQSKISSILCPKSLIWPENCWFSTLNLVFKSVRRSTTVELWQWEVDEKL